MSLRTKKILVFVGVVVTYGTGLFFSDPRPFGFCSGSQAASRLCGISSMTNIGWSFTAVGETLTIVGMIILFANARSWKTWAHFSYWSVPLAALIVIFVFPVPMPLGLELSRVGAIRILGTLYALISAGIVIASYLGAWMRRRKGTPNKA